MSTPNTAQPTPQVAPKRKGKVWGRPFQPGQSGNPGGKTKAKESLAEIARNATPEALRTMITIMRSEKASFAVRAYCADKIIDRAYGKPPQTSNVFVAANQRPITTLSDAVTWIGDKTLTTGVGESRAISPVPRRSGS